MARYQVETCMFCGESPCQCNKSQPKLPTSRQSKPKVEVKVASPKSEIVEPPVIIPQRRAALRPTSKPVITVEIPDKDDSEEFKRALTVLCRAGLVCADDVEKYKNDLNMPDVAIRSLIWRQRRYERVENSTNTDKDNKASTSRTHAFGDS